MHNRDNPLILGNNIEYVLHYRSETEVIPEWVILIFFNMVPLFFKYFILKEAIWWEIFWFIRAFLHSKVISFFVKGETF